MRLLLGFGFLAAEVDKIGFGLGHGITFLYKSHSTFLLVRGTLHPIVANQLEVVVLLSLYLAVLDDQSKEEQFIDVYNIYKRLVYHTAYKIMGDSYLAEDVLQEVFLYVAKNFSKIHRENCHELAAYLVSCSRSRGYDYASQAARRTAGRNPGRTR